MPAIADLVESTWLAGTGQFDAWDHEALALTVGRLRELAQEHASAGALVHAELFSAQLAVRNDDPATALRHLAAARAAAEGVPDRATLAELHVAACYVLLNGDELNEAVAESERAWSLAAQSGDARQRARSALMLGISYQRLAEPDHAAEWFARARALARESGLHLMGASIALKQAHLSIDLAHAAANEGLVAEAQRHGALALAELDAALNAAGERPLPAYLLCGVMLVRAEQMMNADRHDDARAVLHAYLAEHDGTASGDQRVQARGVLAQVLLAQGEMAEANRQCLQAIELAESAQLRGHLGMLSELGAHIAETMDDPRAAVGHLRRLLKVRDDLAMDAARRSAALAAVKLDTERALAQAAADRDRASQLDLDNTALRQQAATLREVAHLDPLTGLPNRRRLDERLPQAHAQAVARRTALWAAVLDVDHFKRVNDTFGHAVGDEVLKRLAVLLREQCREQDLLARVGGEEFVIVFTDITPAGALEACERLRRCVEEADWNDLTPGLAVTISQGLAETSRHSSARDGLAAADGALYAAKHNGRNRVELAG